VAQRRLISKRIRTGLLLRAIIQISGGTDMLLIGHQFRRTPRKHPWPPSSTPRRPASPSQMLLDVNTARPQMGEPVVALHQGGDSDTSGRCVCFNFVSRHRAGGRNVPGAIIPALPVKQAAPTHSGYSGSAGGN
jgi:hypothetical protein